MIFKDNSDLRNPNVIIDTIRESSLSYSYKDSKAINIGPFVVDYNSIFVEIKPFKLLTLPEKPVYKGHGKPSLFSQESKVEQVNTNTNV